MEIYNNMKRSGKKGLSPVIASVLMIMLVLVLAAMIFLWARGFISEQIEKFGKPVSEACAAVNFDVVKVGDNLEVINRGNVGIRSLDIKMFKNGNSEIANFEFGGSEIGPGDAISEPIILLMEDKTAPDSVIAYPLLLGSVRGKSTNKPFTCTDAGKTILL